MHDQPTPAVIAVSDNSPPFLDDPALTAVPSGAFALAGMAVGLLVVAWLAIYFFVFIARGPVS